MQPAKVILSVILDIFIIAYIIFKSRSHGKSRRSIRDKTIVGFFFL